MTGGVAGGLPWQWATRAGAAGVIASTVQNILGVGEREMLGHCERRFARQAPGCMRVSNRALGRGRGAFVALNGAPQREVGLEVGERG